MAECSKCHVEMTEEMQCACNPAVCKSDCGCGPKCEGCDCKEMSEMK